MTNLPERDRPENLAGVPQIEVTPEMIDKGAAFLAESGILWSDRWTADNPAIRDVVASLLATCLSQREAER